MYIFLKNYIFSCIYFFSDKIIYLQKKFVFPLKKFNSVKKSVKKKIHYAQKKIISVKKNSFCKKNHSGRKCFIP